MTIWFSPTSSQNKMADKRVRVESPKIQHLPKAAPSVAWCVRATRINGRNQPEYKASRGLSTEKEAEDYIPTFVEGAFVFKAVVVVRF